MQVRCQPPSPGRPAPPPPHRCRRPLSLRRCSRCRRPSLSCGQSPIRRHQLPPESTEEIIAESAPPLSSASPPVPSPPARSSVVFTPPLSHTHHLPLQRHSFTPASSASPLSEYTAVLSLTSSPPPASPPAKRHRPWPSAPMLVPTSQSSPPQPSEAPLQSGVLPPLVRLYPKSILVVYTGGLEKCAMRAARAEADAARAVEAATAHLTSHTLHAVAALVIRTMPR